MSIWIKIIKIEGKIKNGLDEGGKKNMKLLELEERMVVDRNDWRRRIHVLDQI